MPRPREDLSAVVIDGELVIFDPAGSGVHHLDAVAALVWQQLDGCSPVAGLVADLADAFGADEAQVATDVDALLDDLRSAGLLARRGADPEAAGTPLDETRSKRAFGCST